MRNLILNPRDALYTHDMADSEVLEKISEISEELKNGGKIRNPVYVMRFAKFGDRLVLFNGNKRTKACELNGLSLRALEIQTQNDFNLIQKIQPSSWHTLEEEDYLGFNGEYFYVDTNKLKQQGLALSPYYRARKRVRDAVETFNPWL